MIKRIITFVLCVALCVSCIAIGVINQKANEAGAVAGAIGGAGNGTVDKISADVPEGATQVEETELYEKDGVYYLGSDIDLTAGANATYDKLVALIDNKANGETAVTIDGLGNTITTNKTLFTSIGNVTIMNLNVAGSVEATASPCGVIANSAANFTVKNVTNDADITCIESAGGVNIGGFFGSSSAPATYTDCVNNGDVTVDINDLPGVIAGGIVGIQHGVPTFTNCVNNGNINVGTAKQFAWVGGIVGQAASSGVKFDKVLNTGNVTAKNSGVDENMVMVGGIIGHNQKLQMTDVINLGNVSFIYSGSANVRNADAFRFNVGGVLGRGHHSSTFKRVINTGNVSMTDVNKTGSRNAIGGISPWRYKAGANTSNNFIDCIDIGTHSSTSVDNMATITPYSSGTISKTVNCYTTYFAGHKKVDGSFNGPSNGNDRYFITLPENIGTLLANIKAKGITDGAAIFSAILAVSEYNENYAHNNDDGMFLSSFEGFTVTAAEGRNDYFTTAINKQYIENIKTILGVENVEFGAIIAPATYVTKIVSFSHDAFDAYYEANKAAIDAKVEAQGHDPITALYMTAAFGDGADFTDVEGVYNAGIYLKGAYDIAYAAKMFIKVADGAYVYSK